MKLIIEKVRTYSLKKAGYCSVTIGCVNIVVHILTIMQILPYTWINGGRTESYIAAKDISISSIIFTVVNILIALIASQIIPLKMNKFFGIVLSVFLIATLPMSIMGIVQQFLGTIFEKCVMSIVTIIGFVSDVRIAFEKRW